MIDAKDEVIKILQEAIPQLQATMQSASQGCGKGRSGEPPLNWQGRQVPGNSAVKILGEASTALAKAQASDDAAIQQIKQQIISGLNEWNTFINSLHDSCEMGPHGEDPVNYGNYVLFRNQLKEQLKTALRFL